MTEPKVHKLKSWPSQFAALRSGKKTFEYRKNDRFFAVGDVLELREWERDNRVGGDGGGYTGQVERRVVVHILSSGFGLPDGYCVLGVEPLEKET